MNGTRWSEILHTRLLNHTRTCDIPPIALYTARPAFHPCHKNRPNIERIDAYQTLMRGNLLVGGNIEHRRVCRCAVPEEINALPTDQSIHQPDIS